MDILFESRGMLKVFQSLGFEEKLSFIQKIFSIKTYLIEVLEDEMASNVEEEN